MAIVLARKHVRIHSVALLLMRAAPPHEMASHTAVARGLAELHGVPLIPPIKPVPGGSDLAGCYVVPNRCLIEHPSQRLSTIRQHEDFFGGLAPFSFVSTKAITHPLVGPHVYAPAGWSEAFAQRVARAVLPGFTAFTRPDAQQACRLLLERGPVRIKPVYASAGRGQSVVNAIEDLNDTIAAIDDAALHACGLTLEMHLEGVTTFSVGQVRVCGITASYVGTQSLTQANDGATVYGGSALNIVRGGFDTLLRGDWNDAERRAIVQARRYDEIAHACFKGLLASRRNYDMVEGVDADDRRRSGVLEQSWRIGGASGAEIAALLAFAHDPSCQRVRAETVERYGVTQQPPENAQIVYHDHDPDCGPMLKYVTQTLH
jgi:hypothetical protein